MGTMIVVILGGLYFSLFLIFAVLDTLSLAIPNLIDRVRGDD